MPNATVVLSTDDTSETKRAVAGPDGLFVIPTARPGEYDLSINDGAMGLASVQTVSETARGSDVTITVSGAERASVRAFQAGRSVRFGFRLLF